MSAKRFPECLNELNEQAATLGIHDRFITINAYLSDEELQGLTAAVGREWAQNDSRALRGRELQEVG